MKYHRGRPDLGIDVWIFGLIERDTNRLILFPVDDRSKDTLVPIIRKFVKLGTTIYSDSWSSYLTLNKEGFKHFTVCHKQNFKQVYEEITTKEKVEVHTNRIEGAWKHAKDYFRTMNGCSFTTFESNLCAVMWHNWVKTNVFGTTDVYEAFFNDVKSVFHLKGDEVFLHPQPGPIFSTWPHMYRQIRERDTLIRVEKCAGTDDIESLESPECDLSQDEGNLEDQSDSMFEFVTVRKKRGLVCPENHQPVKKSRKKLLV